MIHDNDVLVLVSAPVGHSQDILKFEKAFVEHVEIVKKKEKKHKNEVNVYTYLTFILNLLKKG